MRSLHNFSQLLERQLTNTTLPSPECTCTTLQDIQASTVFYPDEGCWALFLRLLAVVLHPNASELRYYGGIPWLGPKQGILTEVVAILSKRVSKFRSP